MFMAYLVLATFCFGVLGFPKLLQCLGLGDIYDPWPHIVPEIVFAMIYILSVVLCLAVGIMLLYHIWEISNGETSVESQDHELYRRRAKARREVSIASMVSSGR